MSHPRCIDGMRPENIHPTARIEGQSLLSGEHTRIGPGAVISDSFVKNVVIEEGARIVDSVLNAGDAPWIEQIRSDFEARWVSSCPPSVSRVGRNTLIQGSALNGCGVGTGSKIARTSAWGSRIGDRNTIDNAQCDGSTLGGDVTILGPTEVGGSWVGHHTRIDQMGCNGAIYSNDFAIVEFDPKCGRLAVKEVLDLPHVSRYGLNMISSLHSGLLGPVPGSRFESFGRPAAGWGGFGNCLWYMGKNRFDPCCWIGGWTKVVGLPCQTVFRSYEDLLTKNNSTHVLPFSLGGKESSTVAGQTIPGEMNNGDHYRQRAAAWVFTYAPEAVFAMVKRVHAVCGKEIADRLVDLTLRNALHFIRYTARGKGVRLDASDSAKGWGGWYAKSLAAVQAHLESGLWEFSDGEPVNWHREKNAWVPRNPGVLLGIAPDALEKQCSEEDLLACDQLPIGRQLGPTDEELSPTRSTSFISPEARVDKGAFIGPGVQVLGASVVEEGAWLYRTIVKDSTVRKNVRAYRSYFDRSEIANTPEVVCAGFINSTVESNVACRGSRALDSRVSPGCRLDPFSNLTDTTIARGAIIGGIARGVNATSNFFLVHPQGYAQNVRGVPSVVEVDGKRIELHGLPMIGGGGRIYGTPEAPVELECCFIGSNSIFESGAYVGLGCFVVDGLQAGEGLLPFTLSKGPGPGNDQLAAVLFQFPAIVISSIVSPTYHGTDSANQPYVAYLVTGKIREALDAIRWMIGLRASGKEWEESSPFAKYRNLRHYSEAQLKTGLQGFETALRDGRWEMEFRDGELRFVGKGAWIVNDGNARWQAGG